MNTLYLIGQGGHARAVKECIQIDKNLFIEHIDYIEAFEVIVSKDKENSFYHIAVGDPILRGRIAESLLRLAVTPKTIRSVSSYVSEFAVVGKGTVIMPGAVLRSGVVVGAHSIINSGAVIEHDSHVGEFSNIATGGVVTGGVSIGQFCQIGAGAVVINAAKICSHVTLGAGAVVLNDIFEPGVYVGLPARRIK